MLQYCNLNESGKISLKNHGDSRVTSTNSDNDDDDDNNNDESNDGDNDLNSTQHAIL